MRELILVCAVILSAAINVQSGAIYRTIREIDVPQALEVVPQQEFIAELRKEEAPAVVSEPVILIREDVLVPVATQRNAEPTVEVEEPIAIINEVVPGSLRNDALPLESVDQELLEEQQLDAEQNDNVIRNDIEPENIIVGEEDIIPENTEDVQPGIKQNSEQSSTAQPTLLQQAQQFINNNPFGQFIDTIRRPTTRSPNGEQQLTAESTTNANILQQLQQGVQSFGNQISSAFTPQQQSTTAGQQNVVGAESAPPVSSVRPPNIIETLQTNFQNAVNNVFRPNETPGAGAQPGPLQSVLSNVQNFFTGNRGEAPAQSSTTAQQNQGNPVDDKVDYNLSKNSGEVKEPVVTSEAKPDDSVLLVGGESSLENESE